MGWAYIKIPLSCVYRVVRTTSGQHFFWHWWGWMLLVQRLWPCSFLSWVVLLPHALIWSLETVPHTPSWHRLFCSVCTSSGVFILKKKTQMEDFFFFFSVTFCDMNHSCFDFYDCNVLRCHFSLDLKQIFSMLIASASKLHSQSAFVKHL